MVKEPSSSPSPSARSSFFWRVLALLGRQLTFLCSMHLLRLPFVCLYYFYVWLPLFFLALVLKYALVVLQVSSRRSSNFKRLVKHYVAFHQTIINIIRKIRRSSLSELSEWILTTVYEVVFTIFDESEDSFDVSNPLQFAELTWYAEVEEPHNPQQRRRENRMRHLMHHHVPSRPFRASVRLHPQNSSQNHSRDSSCGSAGGGSRCNNNNKEVFSSTRQSLSDFTSKLLQGTKRSWVRSRAASRDGNAHQKTDDDYLGGVRSNTAALMDTFGFRRSRGGHLASEGGTCENDLWSEVESVSRTSVPRSPETYARVMDRSRDRVDSVVFFVRDKLRLEEQRQSHDENSRSMASQLLGKGKFGVFDPYHTNKGLELTAGLHCAGVRKTRQGSPSQFSSSVPCSSPTKRPRNGNKGEETDLILKGRNSYTGLDSLENNCKLNACGSLPPSSPLYFSTRAAIPLMQDAFVYFEYFIKSSSPGSLTSSGASGSGSGSNPLTLPNTPVVCLGLASCDFSLDAMVGDDDRSVGLGLFPEDCRHPCQLFLSDTSVYRNIPNRHRQMMECDRADEEDGSSELNRSDNYCKKSFEMLGSTASSGDSIGILVYVCGPGGGGSKSSFGRDPSNDCLFHESVSNRERQNSLDGLVQNLAGCTPRQASNLFLNDEYEYDFTHDDEEDECEDDDHSRHSTHLERGLMEEADGHQGEEEEEGMHVWFNLNGCPLNVPWHAVSQIAEMPWGQTALYPTVSFMVPISESTSPPAQSHVTTGIKGNSDSKPIAIEKSPELRPSARSFERENSHGSSHIFSHNTVKISGGFCVDDVQNRTREAIGAPSGVCVYCLDGSILLTEDDP